LSKDNRQTCYQRVQNDFGRCKRVDCKFYINCSQFRNCSVIAADTGPMTLQEIGDIFGITRMRICQIQKRAIQKLLNSSSINDCNV
jgi:hypothetical protein